MDGMASTENKEAVDMTSREWSQLTLLPLPRQKEVLGSLLPPRRPAFFCA